MAASQLTCVERGFENQRRCAPKAPAEPARAATSPPGPARRSGVRGRGRLGIKHGSTGTSPAVARCFFSSAGKSLFIWPASRRAANMDRSP